MDNILFQHLGGLFQHSHDPVSALHAHLLDESLPARELALASIEIGAESLPPRDRHLKLDEYRGLLSGGEDQLVAGLIAAISLAVGLAFEDLVDAVKYDSTRYMFHVDVVQQQQAPQASVTTSSASWRAIVPSAIVLGDVTFWIQDRTDNARRAPRR